MKTILSLFDHSGRWSDPYKNNGYEVIKVDIKDGKDCLLFPSSMSDTPRFPRDFNDIRNLDIYGILAAPPCTVFSGSGACRARSDDQMRQGLSLVDCCFRIVWATKPKFWAIENPVGKLVKFIGDYQFKFDPYEFAGWSDDPDEDRYTKKTCLWGSFNVPEKKPIDPIKVCEQGSWIQKLGGKSDRTKELRSITPKGFSLAFYESNQ